MTKRIDNLEFAAIVARETNGTFNAIQAAHYADHLITLARRHHTACERYCNDADFKPETIERIEEQITDNLGGSGMAAIFQRDPRGATVKLTMPSGYTNDWGQTGVCVPTS